MQPLHFLIVRLRAIGDVLISTCIAETLRANFPDAQIDYVVYENCAAVLKNNPCIDNAVVIPGGKNKSAWQMLKALSFLRKQKYDYIIDVIRTPKSLILSKLMGAKQIIGAHGNDYRDRFYDKHVKLSEDFLSDCIASTTVKYNLQLLTPINEQLNYVDQYRMHFTEKELQQAKNTLQKAGVDISKPFVFFGINNSMPEIKSWPLDHFAAVIDACHQDYAIQTLSYPGPGELIRDNQLREKLKTPDQHFTIANEALRELAIIIELSVLFIGNNSSPMHIALATDTPSISISAPHMHPLDWHPCSNEKHCILSIQSVCGYTEVEYNHFLASFDFKQHVEFYQKITIAHVLRQVADFFH